MLRKFSWAFCLFSAAFFWGQVMESARPVAHAQIGYTGGGTTITGYTDGDVPAAGASGDIWQFDATLNAMDGSDTVGGLVIDIENADHTGSSNEFRALVIDAITGDAQAREIGIDFNGDIGFDAHLRARNLRLMSGPTDGAISALSSNGNTRWTTNVTSSVSDLAFPSLLQGTGNKGYLEFQNTFTAMDGSDTASYIQIDGFTDSDHAGTGNDINALEVGAITSPDAQARHHAVLVGTGWDAFMTAAVGGAYAADEDPPTNHVSLYIDEDTNRTGAAGADCTLVARLSDGTEISVATLVTDGGCP